MSELFRCAVTRRKDGLSGLLDDDIALNQVDLYAPVYSRHSSFKYTALLVDDVIITQRVTDSALRRAGYRCDIASNGEQAVHMAKKNSYDAILMDVALPVMDGVEATRQIREHEKAMQRNRIVIYALTANCSDSDLNRYNEVGMDGCFEKGCIVWKAIVESLALTQQNPNIFVFVNARNDQVIGTRSD